MVILTAVASFLLFLVLLDSVTMPYLVDVDRVKVADIRNRGMAEAEAHMKRRGLRAAVLDSVFHERLPIGTIVEQTPAPGSYIKKGRRVFVRISKGRRLYQVPNLGGVSLREAQLRLQAQQLQMGRISYVSSTTVPPLAVVRHHPAAGGRVRRGQKVNLEISSGSPFDPKRVPDLRGLHISAAEDSLQKYEMKLGDRDERLDPDSPPGTVLSQNPAPESMEMRHTRVDVIVSVGLPDQE